MTYYPFDPDWDIERAADEAAYSDMREEFGHLTLWSLLKYMSDDDIMPCKFQASANTM